MKKVRMALVVLAVVMGAAIVWMNAVEVHYPKENELVFLHSLDVSDRPVVRETTCWIEFVDYWWAPVDFPQKVGCFTETIHRPR